jgi:hypothetical protein
MHAGEGGRRQGRKRKEFTQKVEKRVEKRQKIREDLREKDNWSSSLSVQLFLSRSRLLSLKPEASVSLSFSVSTPATSSGHPTSPLSPPNTSYTLQKPIRGPSRRQQ